MRLSAIDPTGLSDKEKTSREMLIARLANDEEAAEFKEWEMPINQMGGIYADCPQSRLRETIEGQSATPKS